MAGEADMEGATEVTLAAIMRTLDLTGGKIKLCACLHFDQIFFSQPNRL